MAGRVTWVSQCLSRCGTDDPYLLINDRMSSKQNSPVDLIQPLIYQIRLEGHLDRQWTDWFDGLTITLEEQGDTLLTGPVVDQSALYGLLKKVRDLGMSLVSVIRLEPRPTEVSEAKT